MNIQDPLIEFAKKHAFKEKAFASIEEVMNASI